MTKYIKMKKQTSKFAFTVAALAFACVEIAGSASSRLNISSFAETGLNGWQSKSFAGQTEYKLSNEGSRTVLRASSRSSASGLGKKIRIDLTKTPYVNWSWKIDNRISAIDETTRSGDDYPARLYLIKSGGAFVWKTRSLNYVWSSNQQEGEIWPNAFQPKNAIMLAARGVDDEVGEWVTEKRNVREDFKAAFGKDITSIDAIAIMTDTDNSMQRASAAYGEIYFTAE